MSTLRSIVSNVAAGVVMLFAILFVVTIACLMLGGSMWLTLKVWHLVVALL